MIVMLMMVMKTMMLKELKDASLYFQSVAPINLYTHKIIPIEIVSVSVSSQTTLSLSEMTIFAPPCLLVFPSEIILVPALFWLNRSFLTTNGWNGGHCFSPLLFPAGDQG